MNLTVIVYHISVILPQWTKFLICFLFIVITMESERYNNNVVHHNYTEELTNEDKKYAMEYLNETDENRENDVAEIRRWLEDELRIRIDNFFILRFLRVCKFNLEKTKTRIRNYYKQLSHLPEWYLNKDPFRPELQELLDLGILLPLRKPDSQGRVVFLIRGTRHDPRIHTIPNLSKAFILAIEMAMKYYPAASVYGCAMFFDVINPTIRHIFQFRPYVIMNMVHAWQSCYPMRYQTITVFNVPTFFDIVIRIMKSFMTEKMKNRFYVYSHRPQCFKDIPANILPVEYGGTDGTMKELTEYWKKLIEENRDWLLRDENVKIE
ncbi:PREDICTED: alpha-tocopherol transfer protein-like [Wasmannia auropunctata]|uniref:alpha-tocopherol transfer protein-like n=1 Tax=Wasmannia auropunctata TaxID=64793 RepID=UPI0005EDFA23|nr:PREDICTED: alpha-tocopherol transfer protein-like [Wasmannia auropunctata]